MPDEPAPVMFPADMFKKLLQEGLRTELTPLKKRLEDLESQTGRPTSANTETERLANERKAEIARQKALLEKALRDLDTEAATIDANTWTHPATQTAPGIQPSGLRQTQNRFRAEMLPKFHFGDNLDAWLIELDHAVRLWGEQVVCPHILSYCFVENDVIRVWYLGLESFSQTHLSTGTDCWSRFKTAMQTKWGTPIGVKQNRADERRKLPGETFTEYAIHKIEMCRQAYPDASQPSIIEKVRTKLDADADRYCRECNNIEAFIEELVRFDGTVKRAGGTRPMERVYRRQDTPIPPAHFGQTAATRPPQGPNPSQNIAGQGNRINPPPQRPTEQRDPRISSIQDRLNPETARYTRSFVDRNGRTVFLQRACEKCLERGQTSWHFRFECPHTPQLGRSAFISHRNDDDDGLSPPGTSYTPYTSQPTSYKFQNAPKEIRDTHHGEDNTDAEDSETEYQQGNGSRDQ